jgi:Fe2+ transport system protein FeoA
MSDPIALDQLHPGQQARIVRIGGSGALRRRLAEMGILRGESIRVERVAPLGDPVAYLIKGYRLSLRKEDAARIEVTLNGEAHA